MVLDSKLDWVSTMPCFSTLPPSQLEAVVDKVKLMSYAPGESIINQGAPGQLFGILVAGDVLISALGPNGVHIPLGSQRPGFYFGETAAVGNTVTTATIKAGTNGATVLALGRKELEELAETFPDVKDSLLRTAGLRLKQNLLAIPIFMQMQMLLEREKYDLLSTLFEVQSVASREVLFSEGDVGDRFYIVCEGCIRISSRTMSEGKHVTLAMLTKNAVFGEIALLEETTRTATATAFEPSLLLSISREKFQGLLAVFPTLGEVMVPILKERTCKLLKKIPFFENLSTEKRNCIGEMLAYVSFVKGMKIFSEGDASNGMYIIIEGNVRPIFCAAAAVVVVLDYFKT